MNNEDPKVSRSAEEWSKVREALRDMIAYDRLDHPGGGSSKTIVAEILGAVVDSIERLDDVTALQGQRTDEAIGNLLDAVTALDALVRALEEGVANPLLVLPAPTSDEEPRGLARPLWTTVDIVFKGEGPHLQFVETELPDGTGVGVGEWVRDAKPGWPRLRLRVASTDVRQQGGGGE